MTLKYIGFTNASIENVIPFHKIVESKSLLLGAIKSLKNSRNAFSVTKIALFKSKEVDPTLNQEDNTLLVLYRFTLTGIKLVFFTQTHELYYPFFIVAIMTSRESRHL